MKWQMFWRWRCGKMWLWSFPYSRQDSRYISILIKLKYDEIKVTKCDPTYYVCMKQIQFRKANESNICHVFSKWVVITHTEVHTTQQQLRSQPSEHLPIWSRLAIKRKFIIMIMMTCNKRNVTNQASAIVIIITITPSYKEQLMKLFEL